MLLSRRLAVVGITAMMLAAMMALSGMALAQGDVCVSIKGDTKVDNGDSTCFSDATSKAVAVNDSDAIAQDEGSRATAVNNSDAFAADFSRATAVNDSSALAINCIATAHNGEVEECFE